MVTMEKIKELLKLRETREKRQAKSKKVSNYSKGYIKAINDSIQVIYND